MHGKPIIRSIPDGLECISVQGRVADGLDVVSAKATAIAGHKVPSCTDPASPSQPHQPGGADSHNSSELPRSQLAGDVAPSEQHSAPNHATGAGGQEHAAAAVASSPADSSRAGKDADEAAPGSNDDREVRTSAQAELPDLTL